ncbi:MAG: hypothetical protein Q9204_005812 [Flavoplaca sp. TL-2023a]
MSLLGPFVWFLAAAFIRATPIVEGPSGILRRAPSAPSPYPLGAACGNEWQYLNFNPDNKKTELIFKSFTIAFARGRYVQYLVTAGVRLESDDEDDVQTHVSDVLALTAGTDADNPNEEVGTIVGTFVVDNLDFSNSDQGEPDCDEDTLAYTLTDELDDREKIHFCEPSWIGRRRRLRDFGPVPQPQNGHFLSNRTT